MRAIAKIIGTITILSTGILPLFIYQVQPGILKECRDNPVLEYRTSRTDAYGAHMRQITSRVCRSIVGASFGREQTKLGWGNGITSNRTNRTPFKVVK